MTQIARKSAVAYEFYLIPKKVPNRKRPSESTHRGLTLNVNKIFMNNFVITLGVVLMIENERSVTFQFLPTFDPMKNMMAMHQNGASQRKLVKNDFQKVNCLFLTFQKLISGPKSKRNSTILN